MRFAILSLLLSVTALDAEPGASSFKVPAGFTVTEFADHTLANDIYCMTVDGKGRIVVAGRGYIRILVDDDGDGRADRAIEFASGPKDGAMGLCWEGATLFAMGDGGLRRFFDKDGDGKADGPSQLIRAMKTGGEHCAHAIKRGPDGWLYVLCGNNTEIDSRYATLPTSPVKDPVAGCVLRFSPDLKQSEIVAHGFRNPYGMDFNQDGELFTFDSDNERCVALPWYEPTRFYHVVEGGFYGWLAPQRANFWRFPPYFIDVVPPVAYLGRGSPTGVVCYCHGQFPAEYLGGMFLCDWTFGKVHFATLQRQGASYQSTTKVFLESIGDNGFAPTAALVHPDTGDLFIAIGGRGTRGAVYRVRYEKGPHTTQPEPIFTTAPRSLKWAAPMRDKAVALLGAPNLADRLRALETMNRFPAQFTEQDRLEAVKLSGASPDRAIHQACVTLLRDLIPTLSKESKQKIEAGIGAPRALLTLAHAYASIEPAKTLFLLQTILASDQDERMRLDALRVLQIAVGDVGSPRARGSIWEGYSMRAPRADTELASLGRKVAWKALGRGAKKDIHQEFFRTAALLEMGFETVRPYLLPDQAYDPPALVHDYASLARLPGKRNERDTQTTAQALLSLDRLAAQGKWNRDLHWPLRIAELYQGLAEKDPRLPAAMLADAEFGRPDHALFARAKGIDRKKAAAIFLSKIAHDKEYALNPTIALLLAELPPHDVLQVLRPRWGLTGVESALLPILAQEPLAEDRAKFIEGLTQSQSVTFTVCLEALEKLGTRDDGAESVALIRALGNVPAKQRDLRGAIARRLASISGQKLADDKEAWATWFAKAHPDKAARLSNPDGVDVGSWTDRLARLDWSKGINSRGRQVFTKASCINCHSGTQALGPDLAGVAGRFSRADLFTAIIQPSRDVPARYQTTVVETSAGKIYQGLVIYDAVDSLILQTGPATTVRLPGEAVISRRVSPLSLMPPGLLDRLSDDEIVDLYAYLKVLGKKK